MLSASPDTAAVVSLDIGALLVAIWLSMALDTRAFADRMVYGITTALLIATYAIWRIGWTMEPSDHVYVLLWQHTYLAFELVAILYSLMSIVILMRRSDHSPEADAAQAKLHASGDWPGVDVFICTYNEPLDVLEKSVLLAQDLDYTSVRIFVLDDTRRGWVKDYCDELGINYITRQNNEGAKAGNLNNALRVTSGPEAGSLILVLDADFAPHAQFLRRTVGLFGDPKVGLVQTPQHYFNADPIQHNLHASQSWVDDQRIFFDVFQPAKDAWGCAFCVGTSFVVRRDLLEQIGGLPTGSVSEDLSLSYALMRRGYVTRWLNERLSIGLAAEGLPEYVTQRARWCLGTVQAALLPEGTLRGAGLTLSQRLHSFHGLLNWVCKPFILLMLAAPLIYWFAGIPAFASDYVDFLRFAIPALIFFYFYSSWIGHRRTLPLFMEVTHLITAVAISWTLITCLYRPFGRPFKVTDKGGDRNSIIIRWNMLAFFGAMTLISITAILLGLLGPDAAGEPSPVDLLNLLWAGVAALLCAVASLVSIDRPRRHREALFNSEHSAWYISAAGEAECVVSHLSTTTLVLSAASGLPGHRQSACGSVQLLVQGVGKLDGVVTSATGRDVTVRLTISEARRRDLVRHMYSMPNENVAREARFGSAWLGVARSGLGRI
jgi:cellulose synthase (UDP-forming)